MTTATETTTLTRVGDGLALVIDAAMLARLGITAETPLRIESDGHRLTISPQASADPISDEQFDAAVKHVLTKYDRTFRELAK